MPVILQILENLVLLTFLGLGIYAVESLKPRIQPYLACLLHGVSFGLVAFLVTSTPVSLGDGATLDARAGPVILAGVLAGPLAGFVAAALGGLARGFVGGSFAFSGVIVYFVYAVVGSLVWLLSDKSRTNFLTIARVLALSLASCLGAACMFFLIKPADRAMSWLQNDLPLIMLANTLSIIFTTVVVGITLAILAKGREINEVYDRLSLAKKASGIGVWDFDLTTGKLTWDQNSKSMHGLTDEDFQGTFEDWSRNVHPDDLGPTQNSFSRALEEADFFDAEYRVVHPDGTHKTIKGDAILIRDRDREGRVQRVVGTNLDLTKIRVTEEQLQVAQLVAVQAQKFESIGQLTGGVAHDFNNLLAVIMGNLELISDEMKTDAIDREEVNTLLDASLEATQRGADLTKNMLAYARKARLSPVKLDLNEVVRETEKWMRRTIPSRIEIETNLQAGLWRTMADKSSLQSALVNLLVNARDAFDGSGKVTIETGNMRVGDEYIADRQEDIAPGRYAMLAVSDNGNGIDPAILNSIFDPFFTTKRVGEGSGLGLSMVQGFVKQSGGAIRVYSEPGVGSSFKMYFPVIADEADHELEDHGAEHGQDEEIASGAKRILLVEDRAEVLDVYRKTLSGAGYTVIVAMTGNEGLDQFKRSGPFDVVVTDIVMPGELQGPGMARAIRAIAPDTKFIFLSGYASEATVHGNGLRSEDIRLMKPVSRKNLLSAVADCL